MKIGFMSLHFVWKPPEKSMKANANVPTLLAAFASEKFRPPGPSTPASIPMARKRMRAGTLIFSDREPATRLRKKRSPATRKGFTVCNIE